MKTFDPLPIWKEPLEYVEWGKSFEPPMANAWLERIGDEICPIQAIAVCRLFVPNFVEQDGCVFLEHKFELDNFRILQAQLDSRAQIENLINHTHVYDLFRSNSEFDERSFIELADLLATMWERALSIAFDDREFEVLATNSDQDYGPIVTFFTKANETP
ncbi:MAG: hypothetical protein ABJD13_10650 [Paracoccaceae bacterium]